MIRIQLLNIGRTVVMTDETDEVHKLLNDTDMSFMNRCLKMGQNHWFYMDQVLVCPKFKTNKSQVHDQQISPRFRSDVRGQDQVTSVSVFISRQRAAVRPNSQPEYWRHGTCVLVSYLWNTMVQKVKISLVDFTFDLWWLETRGLAPRLQHRCFYRCMLNILYWSTELLSMMALPEHITSVSLCCRLCGRKLKSTVITRESNMMTVQFSSDSSYVDQGFTAEYEAFVPTNRKTMHFATVPPVFRLIHFRFDISFLLSDCSLLLSISLSWEVPVHQQPVHQRDSAVRRLERLRRRQRRGRLRWVWSNLKD